MNFNHLRNLLSRRDVKQIIIYSVAGGVLQLVCMQLVQAYPNFFEVEGTTKNNSEPEVINDKSGIKSKPVIVIDDDGSRMVRLRRFLVGGRGRGGIKLPLVVINFGKKIVQVALVKVPIGFKYVVKGVAKHGFFVGVGSATTNIVVEKIPFQGLSTVLRYASPMILPDHGVIKVHGKTIYLDPYSQDLDYLFKILSDPSIPFEKRREIARSILLDYIDLSSVEKRSLFIIGIVIILLILFSTNISSYLILIKTLIEAIKSGKISKALARAIIRKLKRKKIPVDPAFLDSISEKV
jgi:hypothetical protein